jgi:hypothetical protein
MAALVIDPYRNFLQTGSTNGYLREVACARPNAILRPIGGVAEGLSHALLGLRNTVDPVLKSDEEDVWNIQP